jgi:diguanylate cyclase (GGDEF)-like protein
MDRLQQALATAERSNAQVAVLFLDLDHFKQVNDLHGHDVGDALLQEAARRLSGVVRQTDTVARLGGDEFVVLLTGVKQPSDASLVATKIQQAFAELCVVGGHELRIGTSIGIALTPEDGLDGAALLKNADTAMYQVKRAGRSSFREPSGAPPSERSQG